jgi:hypothetical protein
LYLGHPDSDGMVQLNAELPEGLASGLQPVEVNWLGVPIAGAGTLRVVPPGPAVPRIVAVSDATNLLSGTRIVTGMVKITIEEAARPDEFRASIGGIAVRDIDIFRTDPARPRDEINLRLPEGLPPGAHALEMSLGRRRFAPVGLEIA